MEREKPKKVTKSAYIIGIIVLLLTVFLLQIRPDIPVETLIAGYANEESKIIEIDGLNVHFRDEGEGPPLVLVHGAASSLHTWDSWAEDLKSDFRVIRLDLPAFGLTGPHPDSGHLYDLDYYVDFLDSFLQRLGIDNFYLAGNSLGGGIAWLYSSRYPEKVKKTVLVSPVGYSDIGPWYMKYTQSSVVKFFFRFITPEFGVNFFIERLIYADTDRIEEGLTRRYHRLLLREGNRKALMNVMDSMANSDKIDDPSEYLEINVPALILWGELDRLLPVENAVRFKEDIPGSELIIYEDVGHVPMEELPEETLKDLKEFLIKDSVFL